MIAKLTKDELEIIQANDGLHRYLEQLLVGRKATPRSWLYEQIPAEEVLNNWETVLASLQDGSIPEQKVYQFDTSQKKKWGPQGEVAPISDLMELVEDGFGESPTPKAFSSREWQTAKDVVRTKIRAMGCEALRPASYSRVVDDMRARDTLESNSGWPLFTRRNKPEVIESSIADAESGKWKEYPAIALFRNYNQKTRLVWMFPMSANLVEGSFFQVLQSQMVKASSLFLAPWTGFETVRIAVTNAYNMDNWFLSATDFSATDAHFHLAATMEVFDVIKDCFQHRYRELLRESLVHMHQIPIVIGPDRKEVGWHGVSSGSNWTNFIETLFDWILGFYAYFKHAKRSDTDYYVFNRIVGYPVSGVYVPNSNDPQAFYAIGDDMAWISGIYDEKFPTFIERVGKDVGMEIKAEKATNERDSLVSLQRLFQRGYSRPDGKIRAVYSTIRALKSSVYPERFHKPSLWSSDMFCARQFMILENCVDHPLFEEFVKFVCKGQKDLIPFSKLSKSKLDRILRETKLLPGFNPTYNQERRDSSLGAFESIRIASKL